MGDALLSIHFGTLRNAEVDDLHCNNVSHDTPLQRLTLCYAILITGYVPPRIQCSIRQDQLSDCRTILALPRVYFIPIPKHDIPMNVPSHYH